MQMTPAIRRILTLALLGVAACSSTTDPGVDGTIPPLLYLPAEAEVWVDYGEYLRFEVRDGSGRPYSVNFEIEADTTASASVFEWRVDRVGDLELLAVARAGQASKTHSWKIHASTDGLRPLGPVRNPMVDRSPREGELRLRWLSPNGEYGDPRVAYYEIANSLQPISPSGFEELPKRILEHRTGVEDYESWFQDLPPGQTQYFRVRAVDELDRRGILSEELSAIPPAYFAVGGRVMVLDQDYDHPMPLGGIHLQAQSQESITASDGSYSFPPLLDYVPFTIQADASLQSPALYSISRVLTDATDPMHDYVLFPQRTVTVQLPAIQVWDYLALLRSLTSQQTGPSRVAHWEDYPVDVEVPEQVLPNGVDYALAIRRGIQKWNDAVGFPVLRESAGPPSLGVVTSYDLPLEGGGVLGRVSLIEPAGGALYQTVPRKLRYALVEWFGSQSLADRVALHELGHVLYLTHSPSLDHVMSAGISGSSPNELHPDEVAVLRTLIHTPNGTAYSWFAPTD